MPRIASLALAVLFAAAPGLAQSQSYEYRVRSPDPRVGSKVSEVLVWSSPLPLDRSLAQLWTEDRKTVRDLASNLKAVEEPPLPARPLREILQSIGSLPELVGLAGSVDLEIEVSAAGKATRFLSNRELSRDLAGEFAYHFERMRFVPAKCAGSPCSATFRFQATYRRE